jgi:hypothetical protein
MSYYWIFVLSERARAFPATERIALALMQARPPGWALDLDQVETEGRAEPEIAAAMAC